MITDVHEAAPDDIIESVTRTAPDVIFIGGDLIEAKTAESSESYGKRGNKNAYDLLNKAIKIAPVIYAPGNHEAYINEAHRDKIKATGAVFLENSSVTVKINGYNITVGGVTSKPDPVWLAKFSQSGLYKILLCHQPEQYIRLFPDLNVDIVLSGHAHGGQWRFFGRGVYAPGQGIFPRYTRGIYKKKLLVSAGASNNEPIPRIFNPCEIVDIEFIK